jgi:hypothetical protein
MGGLMLIADKLYQAQSEGVEKSRCGQPRGGAGTFEKCVFTAACRNSAGLREGQAAALAFSENYTGDRVAALMLGLLTMADAAFEHKEEFYIARWL